jgi:hypothetical protein
MGIVPAAVAVALPLADGLVQGRGEDFRRVGKEMGVVVVLSGGKLNVGRS